jgi:hypothetical protein
MNDEVIDAMEDILRQQGVFDEIKKTLFLSVASVVKKQMPIQTNTKVKEFATTIDGELNFELNSVLNVLCARYV